MPPASFDWFEKGIGDDLLQGDIFNGIPVVFYSYDSPWTFLRPFPGKDGVSPREALSGRTPKGFSPRAAQALPDIWQYNDEEFVLAKAFRKPVMLLTQSCDITHRKWFQVAPIEKVSETGKKLEDLRENRVNYRFYLPSHPTEFPDERYVDLTLITSVHCSYFNKTKPSERLTQTATLALQKTLAKFLGRPFGFDTTDQVEISQEYMCLPCIYARREFTVVDLKAGDNFPICPKGCSPVQWQKAPPHI